MSAARFDKRRPLGKYIPPCSDLASPPSTCVNSPLTRTWVKTCSWVISTHTSPSRWQIRPASGNVSESVHRRKESKPLTSAGVAHVLAERSYCGDYLHCQGKTSRELTHHQDRRGIRFGKPD